MSLLFLAHRSFDFPLSRTFVVVAHPSSTLSRKGDSPSWSPKCVVGFRVRVSDYGVMVNNLMARLMISIAGWGVVPRMAPPPSQGGFNVRGERERKGDDKRERDNY